MKNKNNKNEAIIYLPKTDKRWYCALRRIATWIKDDDEADDPEYFIPWLIIVIDIQSRMIMGFHLSSKKPPREEIHDFLVELMQKTDPNFGMYPSRPSAVHFEQKEIAEALREELQPYGISAFFRPSPGYVNAIVSEMTDNLTYKESKFMDGLLKKPGVTPSLAGHFYEAAAVYFLAEPWIWLSNYDVLKIKVGQDGDTRFVIVMGQAGFDYGLSVHQNWAEVEDLYLIDDPEKGLPAEGRHIFTYNVPPYIAIDDLLDVQKYGWNVVSNSYFPTPLLVNKRGFARPDAKMLVWYEAALKGIAIFVKEWLVTHPDGSHPPVQATIEVATSKGKTPVQIEFPGGDFSTLEKLPMATRTGWEETGGEDELPEKSELFDHRVMERLLSIVPPSLEGYQPLWRAELYQAQELIYDAWEQRNPREKLRLAKEALRVSPDCADAYVLLAEGSASDSEALIYYEKGVQAGRRALGEEFFLDDDNKDHFWGILETRPYLRSLSGQAFMLQSLNRMAEAEKVFCFLLEINSNDNQGIRYELLYYYFEKGRFEDAARLIKGYKGEISVEWVYLKALLDFYFKGPMKGVARTLRKAIKRNPHVPKYLLGKKKIPMEIPNRFTDGGEDEAVYYASRYLNHWRRIPGAIAWLKSVYAEFNDG